MFRVILICVLSILTVSDAEVRWLHMSSATNQLPIPSTAKLQTGSLVGDFDGDKTNDFILSFGDAAPALVLFRGGTNYTTLAIELDSLPIAAGGAAIDIDQDKDLDIVFGSETGPEIWWWENPSPTFEANKSWARHIIKGDGATTSRGQLFVDLLGSATPQLVFWNQGSNAVYHARVPAEVRSMSNSWAATQIFAMPGGMRAGKSRSLSAFDINIDGDLDLLAGNYWLKGQAGLQFQPTRIGSIVGRSALGRFRRSTFPQVVIAPQNERGRVFWYECKTNPDRSESWAGRQLLGHDIAPAGTLAVADLNKDGNDDIFLAERQEPSQTSTEHSPHSWIFFSDGNGSFNATLFTSGLEIYEAKIADLDGDGDLDILSTPHSAGAPRLDIWLNNTPPSAPPTAP